MPRRRGASSIPNFGSEGESPFRILAEQLQELSGVENRSWLANELWQNGVWPVVTAEIGLRAGDEIAATGSSVEHRLDSRDARSRFGDRRSFGDRRPFGHLMRQVRSGHFHMHPKTRGRTR